VEAGLSADRNLDRDLAALSAGLLPGVVLAAADLDHGLQLIVALERDGLGRTLWHLKVHGNPGLDSDLHLGDTAFTTLRLAVARAIDTGTARGWRVEKRTELLADLGEVAIGLGVAAGTLWIVVMLRGDATLRFPAADLGRVRDVLALAAARIGRAGGVVPRPASATTVQ
jgi:hypothetical protein